MGGVQRWAMTEQASFWEQTDLLTFNTKASVPPDQEPSPASDPPLPTEPLPTAPPPAAPLLAEPPSAAPRAATLPTATRPAEPLPAAPRVPGAKELELVPAAGVPANGVQGLPARVPVALTAVTTAPGTEMEIPAPALPQVDRQPAILQAEPVVSLSGLPGAGTRALPSCPERLLVLDTETTALSRDQGQCIEVGAVLFDVPSRAVLMQVSFLLPCPSNPAEPINGIPAAVSRLSQPWQAGLTCFEAMVAASDAVLAHNANFDRQWFGQAPLPPLSKPWICSMEDIRWPAERQLRATPSVRDLALAYGIPVWAAHRALTDCIYLIQVLERSADLELLLQLALEPRRLYRACLGYAERHRAKEAGFRWNDPVRGSWCRRLSDREVESLSFAVEAVERLDGELPRTA